VAISPTNAEPCTVDLVDRYSNTVSRLPVPRHHPHRMTGGPRNRSRTLLHWRRAKSAAASAG